jgi:hypothetical protein
MVVYFLQRKVYQIIAVMDSRGSNTTASNMPIFIWRPTIFDKRRKYTVSSTLNENLHESISGIFGKKLMDIHCNALIMATSKKKNKLNILSNKIIWKSLYIVVWRTNLLVWTNWLFEMVRCNRAWRSGKWYKIHPAK